MKIEGKKSGLILKSIISRIQGNETEIGKLIDIRDENGEFRSTYDILRDLSNLFKASTKEKQDEIANLAGGKVNSNIVKSLLSNNFN